MDEKISDLKITEKEDGSLLVTFYICLNVPYPIYEIDAEFSLENPENFNVDKINWVEEGF